MLRSHMPLWLSRPRPTPVPTPSTHSPPPDIIPEPINVYRYPQCPSLSPGPERAVADAGRSVLATDHSYVLIYLSSSKLFSQPRLPPSTLTPPATLRRCRADVRPPRHPCPAIGGVRTKTRQTAPSPVNHPYLGLAYVSLNTPGCPVLVECDPARKNVQHTLALERDHSLPQNATHNILTALPIGTLPFLYSSNSLASAGLFDLMAKATHHHVAHHPLERPVNFQLGRKLPDALPAPLLRKRLRERQRRSLSTTSPSTAGDVTSRLVRMRSCQYASSSDTRTSSSAVHAARASVCGTAGTWRCSSRKPARNNVTRFRMLCRAIRTREPAGVVRSPTGPACGLVPHVVAPPNPSSLQHGRELPPDAEPYLELQQPQPTRVTLPPPPPPTHQCIESSKVFPSHAHVSAHVARGSWRAETQHLHAVLVPARSCNILPIVHALNMPARAYLDLAGFAQTTSAGREVVCFDRPIQTASNVTAASTSASSAAANARLQSLAPQLFCLSGRARGLLRPSLHACVSVAEGSSIGTSTGMVSHTAAMWAILKIGLNTEFNSGHHSTQAGLAYVHTHLTDDPTTEMRRTLEQLAKHCTLVEHRLRIVGRLHGTKFGNLSDNATSLSELVGLHRPWDRVDMRFERVYVVEFGMWDRWTSCMVTKSQREITSEDDEEVGRPLWRDASSVPAAGVAHRELSLCIKGVGCRSPAVVRSSSAAAFTGPPLGESEALGNQQLLSPPERGVIHPPALARGYCAIDNGNASVVTLAARASWLLVFRWKEKTKSADQNNASRVAIREANERSATIQRSVTQKDERAYRLLIPRQRDVQILQCQPSTPHVQNAVVNVADFSMNGMFTRAEMQRITYQICGVLSRVHDQGIIHRDLKPEKIVLKDQYPLAKTMGSQTIPKLAVIVFAVCVCPSAAIDPTPAARAGHPVRRRPTEHIITITRQVQWMFLYEWDVSEQAERFIRALLASSPSERKSLVLNHPWLATYAELEGAPQPLPATPPVLHTASLQALPSAPSIVDGARVAEPAHTSPPAAWPMGLRRPPGTASLLRMDGERAAARPCMSLDGLSLILAVHPPSPERAVIPGRPRAVERAVRRERGEPARQAPAAVGGAVAGAAGGRGVPGTVAGHTWTGGGGSGRGPVEEPEPHAMKEATPARENGTLKDDTPVRKAAEKRKSLPEESDDEGDGEAASMLPQTQTREQEDSEGGSKRLGTELSISVATACIYAPPTCTAASYLVPTTNYDESTPHSSRRAGQQACPRPCRYRGPPGAHEQRHGTWLHRAFAIVVVHSVYAALWCPKPEVGQSGIGQGRGLHVDVDARVHTRHTPGGCREKEIARLRSAPPTRFVAPEPRGRARLLAFVTRAASCAAPVAQDRPPACGTVDAYQDRRRRASERLRVVGGEGDGRHPGVVEEGEAFARDRHTRRSAYISATPAASVWSSTPSPSSVNASYSPSADCEGSPSGSCPCGHCGQHSSGNFQQVREAVTGVQGVRRYEGDPSDSLETAEVLALDLLHDHRFPASLADDLGGDVVLRAGESNERAERGEVGFAWTSGTRAREEDGEAKEGKTEGGDKTGSGVMGTPCRTCESDVPA
ncbi:uncharacterized protein BXZ73DRAFT_82330 [Epithele typhae]|uniref:uncharacterized protein n=1 Tax=Epithele typhae TaxID=378194 RepID=UPI0020072E87|nr:uncharacterized protein BXZ73DRAFT_82330 [Epithele typhae]KAH9912401.1 hypothetical protein BXZ73DRAFT_82330 [Epithele typhae]